MTQHNDMIRLKHMLDAAKKAVIFCDGKQRDALDQDEQLALALTRLLEIIGEAANGVSKEYQESHSGILWREIAGTRNRLIHGYFDVDFNVVWEIVEKDLPQLINQLKALVELT